MIEETRVNTAKLREEIEQHVAEYLARGGKIQQVPPGVSGVRELSFNRGMNQDARTALIKSMGGG